MKHQYTIYVAIMAIAIAAMAITLNVLPRSKYSELERRELNKFPSFTLDSLASGDYTKGVGSWYSDTEPFRDKFMTLSMNLRQARALKVGKDEEQITYHAGTDTDPEFAITDADMAEFSDPNDSTALANDNYDMDQNAKITNHGIIVVGAAPNARALMAYHGKGGGEGYARVVNAYKEKFGDDVNIYCMIIPTAIQFYCPEKAKNSIQPETATIDNLYAHLLPSVHLVNLVPVLSQHTDEEIYLRTDHHWAPRGAYYAAQEFARVANVPFMDLSTYEEHVTHRFVGTMYGFSQDIAIKNSPEDFYYWTPTGVEYTVTYTVYDIDEEYRVIGEHKPYQDKRFFFHFRDGSGGAYCTFMGGDTKITKVTTSTKNGRRVIILKDSFGNALPGYLFGSFEEIHVIDGRYFTKNMVDYVAENKITDIVFANNVFKAYAGGGNYTRFLTQHGSGIYTPRPQDSTSVATPTDSVTPISVPSQPETNTQVETSEPANADDNTTPEPEQPEQNKTPADTTSASI